MDRQDIQTRRAENQVWNGSGAYDTKPELLVFDGGGDADLYGNTVLGLAGRYYRFDLFRPLLNDFHRSVQEGLYTDVFFFVLENAVFRRGAQERPILPDLRAAYARTLLRDTPPAEGMTDGAAPRVAQQVLGQPYDKALVPVLADIAAPLKPTEAELIRRTEEILYTHFRRARRSATDRQWAAWVGRKRDASGGVRFVRPNGLRALSRGTGGAGGLQKPTLLSFLQGRTPEPILRRYVEDCFGVSLLTPSQLADMERALCTGVHRNCRLHVTDGTPPQRPSQPGGRVGCGAVPPPAGEEPRLLPVAAVPEPADHRPPDPEAAQHPPAEAGGRRRPVPRRCPVPCAGMAGGGAGR